MKSNHIHAILDTENGMKTETEKTVEWRIMNKNLSNRKWNKTLMDTKEIFVVICNNNWEEKQSNRKTKWNWLAKRVENENDKRKTTTENKSYNVRTTFLILLLFYFYFHISFISLHAAAARPLQIYSPLMQLLNSILRVGRRNRKAFKNVRFCLKSEIANYESVKSVEAKHRPRCTVR